MSSVKINHSPLLCAYQYYFLLCSQADAEYNSSFCMCGIHTQNWAVRQKRGISEKVLHAHMHTNAQRERRSYSPLRAEQTPSCDTKNYIVYIFCNEQKTLKEHWLYPPLSNSLYISYRSFALKTHTYWFINFFSSFQR